MRVIAALALAALNLAAHAATIEMRLSPQLVATADYQAGESSKPAVIILHGFLQTRDFPTVARLAQGIAEQGYTVLTPTLSLGVPKRNQSLACEALHNHSFEGDIAELGRWENWLKQRGHKAVVVIGHSFGSLQALAYAALPASSVSKVIALSLVDTREVSSRSNVETLREAGRRIQEKDNSLFRPAFGFCKEFPTTAANFVSYARWDRSKILRLVRSARQATYIIMGSEDSRMGADWPEKLRAQGANVNIINGANHFFDDQHEFDLLEAVLTNLNSR